MTEIQAIIDKLEAEKGQIHNKYPITQEDDRRLTELYCITKELKKHLPKEDKSSFKFGTLTLMIGKLHPIDRNEYVFSIEFYGSSRCLNNSLVKRANKKEVATIITALQAAHEEMEDE